MAVLFASVRPLERAENLKTVYDLYDGEKAFVRMSPWRKHPEICSGKYSLLVADEFPAQSPGKVLMIGHAMAGGKLYGLDQSRPYITRADTALLTCVITTGCAMVPLTAKQSGVSEDAVLPLGLPRTDAYFGKRKGDGGTFLKDRRAYLYAPTYRNVGETPLPRIDWERIDAALDDGEVLAVKPHMMSGRVLEGKYRHLREISPEEPSTPYLLDCDVVVTDYSTILFDAHILEKPVVLFEKDTGYLQTRGMYLPYPQGYASRYCRTEDELVHVMREAEGMGEADRRCRELASDACDGHSAERICRQIRRMTE